MILVDANLLVYAKMSLFPHHRGAREWLDGRLDGIGRVGLPWPSLLAFLRIVTNARVFERPMGAAAAWEQVDEWLSLPGVWIPEATSRHAEVLGRLILGGSLTANLVPDAHLAALAIEHGLVLYSTDGDFARFADLRWENPLTQG